MKTPFSIILGGIYKPVVACINEDKIPRRMKLVAADISTDVFKLVSVDSVLTATVNRATFEYYFKPLTEN